MKKLIYLFAAFIMGINTVNAKQVDPSWAKQVAENFIRQNAMAKMQVLEITLSYTEKSVTGDPDYYVFDINNNTGFIIVSAEDAGRPIIGYSTESGYQTPAATSNPEFNFWMQKRKEEVEYMRDHNLPASAEITTEWTNYTNHKMSLPQTMSIPVLPLCATKWNQDGGGTVPYNAQCPGGSMTGCVATAMAQIMKKWNYPVHGTGQSSYVCGSYGTLSANYGTTTYNWANMPNTSSNNDVALLSYHCGVSVDMSYSPSGSGANVSGGNPSAQYSYKTYFGYDTIVHGAAQANYSNALWIQMLEAELTAGRPTQYGGFDPNAGGHSWVCDGNDASDNMHMNWGWGGNANGYFAVTSLNPLSYNFSVSLGSLIGIKPKITAGLDAGVSAIVTPSGTTCNTTFTPAVKLQNFGNTVLTSCTILYHVDNNPNQPPYTWNGSLAVGTFTTVTLPSISAATGAHTFTSITSNPNGALDVNPGNDWSQSTFNIVTSSAALPLAEGFESSVNLPTGWSIWNPNSDAAWQISTTVSHTGTNCIGFNNCNGNGTTDMTGTKDRFITTTYDFSTATSITNMTFDVGYIPASNGSVVYTDTLVVYSSTDCGTTWHQLYIKGGTQLATGPGFTISSSLNCVTPTSSQWRTDVVSLSNLAGQSSVMFAFENRSDWGNWIYLDNININAAALGAPYVNSSGGFSLYPNPASSVFTLEGASTAERIHYSIYNIVGEELRAGDLATSGSSFNGKIQVSDFSRGMYFIKVSDGKNTWTKKLNIQ